MYDKYVLCHCEQSDKGDVISESKFIECVVGRRFLS